MSVATAHAVTPSDTRELFRGVNHPVNVAYREHSAQAMALAIGIADDLVRTELEIHADGKIIDGVLWMDTTKPYFCNGKRDQDDEVRVQYAIDRALKYIGLRNPDAFPWRFVRHPEKPELVRFEEQP